MFGRRMKWMMALLLADSLVTVHLALAPARVSAACFPPTCWYAGSFDYGYGDWASIDAPSSLTLANWPAGATETSWVSTDATPNWMQTGWYYDAGILVAVPWSYIEYCINTCGSGDRFFVWGASQGWNNTYSYMVEFDTRYGATAWCAYINNFQARCQNQIKVGPTGVQTMSEIHYNGFTPLKTDFSNLLVKVTSTSWQGQSLSNLFHNPPYQVAVVGSLVMKTYRGATYLPFVTRG